MNGDTVMIKSKFLKIAIIGSMAALILSACGGAKEEAKDKNSSLAETQENSSDKKDESVADIDVKEFAKKIAEGRVDISFAQMNEGYIQGVMNFDIAKTADYVVYVDASGSTVDEFGVFKANDDAGKDVEKMLDDYLKQRLDTWMDEYMPEEKPKVEKAEIKSKGNYYIYAILGDSNKEQLFSEFDSALTK